MNFLLSIFVFVALVGCSTPVWNPPVPATGRTLQPPMPKAKPILQRDANPYVKSVQRVLPPSGGPKLVWGAWPAPVAFQLLLSTTNIGLPRREWLMEAGLTNGESQWAIAFAGARKFYRLEGYP